MKALRNIGMTENQGKVFFALLGCGVSTASTISKTSGVTREKICTFLRSLQELGLVHKRIASPSTYEAMSLSDATDILLEKKKNEYIRLLDEVNGLVQKYSVPDRNVFETEFTSELIVVPKKKALIHRIKKAIGSAENSINWVTSWKQFSRFSLFADELKKARMKGVEICVVVNKPQVYSTLTNLLSLIEIPLSQCKTIDSSPPAMITVYDQKRVFIYSNREAGLTETSAFVTNSPIFVELAISYFEKIWKASQICK